MSHIGGGMMQLDNDSKIGKIATIRARMKKIPRWVKWVSILIIIVAVGGALVKNSQNKPLPVSIHQMKTEDIERVVFASGRLEAMDEQEFFTPVDSTLMQLSVKLGDRVKAGDMLGRLDTLELERLYKDAMATLAGREAELAAAQATSDVLKLKAAETEYTKAKNKVNRLSVLQEAGAASQEEIENAQVDLASAEVTYEEAKRKQANGATNKQRDSLQAQVDLARQAVAQAKERVDLATFVAREDGVVTKVAVEEGNRVLEGTLIMVVGSDKQLKVTADVNEIDAGNLHPGQKVEVTSIALTGKTYKGKITRVGDAAIKKEGSSTEMINVPVTIMLEGDTWGLKIGYSVNLSIQTSLEKKVLTLPMEAIQERGNKKIVYVIVKGSVKERKVTTRTGNELKDVVVSGLKTGEQVITNPPDGLVVGQKVIAQPETQK